MTHTGVQRTPGNRRKARTTLTAAAILTALAVTAFLACGTGDLDRESAGTPVVTTQTPQQQEPTAPQPTRAPTTGPAPTVDAPTAHALPTTEKTQVAAGETAIVAPTERHTASFADRLSKNDRTCVSYRAASDGEVIDLMNDTQTTAGEKVFDCLSNDGREALFVLTARAENPAISEDSYRCMWDGLKPLEELRNTQPDPDDPEAMGRLLAATFAGVPAITSYCTTDQEFAEADAGYPMSAEDREFTECVIEGVGGPAQFMAMLLSSGDELDQMHDQVTQACTQPAKQ